MNTKKNNLNINFNKTSQRHNWNLNDKLKKSEAKINALNQEIIDLKQRINQEATKKYLDVLKQKTIEAELLIEKKVQELKNKNEAELEEMKKYFFANKVKELVSIISQFNRIIFSTPDNPIIKNYLLGFKMFSDQFHNFLNSMGVKEIEIKINDSFDPSIMEVIEIIPQKSRPKQPLVISVCAPGFKLHDRVIQHALVNITDYIV